MSGLRVVRSRLGRFDECHLLKMDRELHLGSGGHVCATAKTVMPARAVIARIFRLRLSSIRGSDSMKVDGDKIHYRRQEQRNEDESPKLGGHDHYEYHITSSSRALTQYLRAASIAKERWKGAPRRLSQNNTIARIIQMVEEAQEKGCQPSPYRTLWRPL